MESFEKLPLVGPKWWQQRLKNFSSRAGTAPELFFQFLFTYGAMTVIAGLSICIYLLSPYDPNSPVVASEIWSIIINSYMPTTITFVGVVLFSEGFFSKHKLRGVVLELLVVSMALAYIAFVSVNEIELSTQKAYQGLILEGIRYLNIGLMIPSITLLPDVYSVFSGKDVKPRSDGRISF